MNAFKTIASLDASKSIIDIKLIPNDTFICFSNLGINVLLRFLKRSLCSRDSAVMIKGPMEYTELIKLQSCHHLETSQLICRENRK